MKLSKPIRRTIALETKEAAEQIEAQYCLKLFITGTTPKCIRAIQNIKAICEENLAGRYELEVIDIYQHPEQAGPAQIVATPTLIKQQPLPVRRLVGDMSDTARVLIGLDLAGRPLGWQPKKDKHDS